MGSKLSPKELARKYCGEAERYKSEHPQRNVTVSEPFYLQTIQVTQGQWKTVMGDNPSFFKDCGDDCPVENLSWDDAQKFIKKLNEIEKIDKYRLPTEAEWEYACRAGTTTEFSFGDDNDRLTDCAWFSSNSGDKTHPVGKKKPNFWGLYDMQGNVLEWVEDDWHDNYDGAPGDGRAWIKEPRGAARVIRGGSWDFAAQGCRSAVRFGNGPGYRYGGLGFRLARSAALGPSQRSKSSKLRITKPTKTIVSHEYIEVSGINAKPGAAIIVVTSLYGKHLDPQKGHAIADNQGNWNYDRCQLANVNKDRLVYAIAVDTVNEQKVRELIAIHRKPAKENAMGFF